MQAKLPRFTELVQNSWRVYKKHFKLIIQVNILSVLIFLGALAFFVVLLLGLLGTSIVVKQLPLSTTVALIVPIAIIFLLLVQSLTALAIAFLVVDVSGQGSSLSAPKYFKKAKPLVLAYFPLIILSAFLTFGGYFFFLFPGILFSIWFSFSVYTFIEGKRGFEALFTSRDCIKGHTFGVFWRVALFGLSTYLLSALLKYFFDKLGLSVLGDIATAVINWAIIVPLSLLFSYQIFLSLKAMKPELVSALTLNRKLKYFTVSLIGIVVFTGIVALFVPRVNDIKNVFISPDYEGTYKRNGEISNQYNQAYDTKRRMDISIITNAVYQYAAENNGVLPSDTEFPATPTCIGTAPECFDLAKDIFPTYISEMPMDPEDGSEENTGYTIYVKPTGRIEASAKSSINPNLPITKER
ncbi:hypothetical protein C4564_00115 [Candidatus Microgenomates bacterium]|nr:MAG: hypothetical protein C4564_00115 [Candidatus Microgenomates bacterium]